MAGRLPAGISFGLGALAGLSSAIGYFVLRPNSPLLPAAGDQSQEYAGLENRTDSLFKYGQPELNISIHAYKAHMLAYDRCSKIPVWVAETITKEMVTSKVANRKKSKFKPDPNVPSKFRSANEDYWKSGWSRGHMTPAGDCKHCQDSMDDTFYLTNIVPQDLDNNSGYWNRLEIYCRDLTSRFDEVNIVSGPLFMPAPAEDQQTGKSFVKYEVIGKNKVAVPTHLFKIILAEGPPSTPPAMGVFIIPNEPIKDVNLTQFQVSLEQLETYTGTIFHSKLDRNRVQDLCTADGCKLISSERIALWIFAKRLNSAKDMEELQQIWQELQNRKELEPDNYVKQTYAKRKAVLQK